jgi:hypothetical protein
MSGDGPALNGVARRPESLVELAFAPAAAAVVVRDGSLGRARLRLTAGVLPQSAGGGHLRW